MSKPVITTENLSKKYTISHQNGNNAGPNYIALREIITEGVKRGMRRFLSAIGMSKEDGNLLDRKEDFWALKRIFLKIYEGERVGIIGRNGAGKTTLLKLLSRITAPTKGSIRLKGRVASLLEVGTGFHPELTGRENIFLNGTVLGMSKRSIREKFNEIVTFAEVEKFLDTPIKRYSSGMKVRLAFAVASHLSPEILLVDEVLSVGDANFQQKCLGRMQDVAVNNGRTILFVSHNLSAVQRLCTRCLLIDKGHLIADGDTEAVIKTYLSSVLKNRGTRKWIDKDFKSNHSPFVPLRACLKDSNGEISDNFFCTEPISVEFDYELKADIDNLRIGVKLYTAQGEWVCLSYDKDDRESYRQTITLAGHYKGICHFPPNFLNEGQYAVALYGSTAFGQIWSELDVLTFTTQIGEGVGSHWSSEEKREGVIRPLLRWENRNLTKREA
jgi:lipopolysaccharide transport system ATP-binding protein